MTGIPNKKAAPPAAGAGEALVAALRGLASIQPELRLAGATPADLARGSH